MRARDSKQTMSRRDFLRQAAGSSGVALGAVMGGGWAAGAAGAAAHSSARRTPKGAAGKTVLTFYMDDTNPYIVGAEAFRVFLDFVAGEGIAGESSVILGYGWKKHGLLSRPKTDEQRAYIEQLHRAYKCGIDSHMELMTHGGRFDFSVGRIPEGARHEGIWLYEPEVFLDEYESYFGHIIEEGEKMGLQFTGVTWPGCGCEYARDVGPSSASAVLWR